MFWGRPAQASGGAGRILDFTIGARTRLVGGGRGLLAARRGSASLAVAGRHGGDRGGSGRQQDRDGGRSLAPAAVRRLARVQPLRRRVQCRGDLGGHGVLQRLPSAINLRRNPDAGLVYAAAGGLFGVTGERLHLCGNRLRSLRRLLSELPDGVDRLRRVLVAIGAGHGNLRGVLRTVPSLPAERYLNHQPPRRRATSPRPLATADSCSAVKTSISSLRTAATWPGAACASRWRPASVRAATTPRTSPGEALRRTSPAFSNWVI